MRGGLNGIEEATSVRLLTRPALRARIGYNSAEREEAKNA
jgi:hypothetical protein